MPELEDDASDHLFLISVGLGLLPSCFSWDRCCEFGGGNTWWSWGVQVIGKVEHSILQLFVK